MDLIISLIIGGIIGYVASLITKSGGGTIVHIIIGIVGSILGNYVFGHLLNIGGATEAGQFNLPGLFWGVLGAVILIAILKAVGVMGGRRV